MLSLAAVSWLYELEYWRLEELKEEAERAADKARRLDNWLGAEFNESPCLDENSLAMRAHSVLAMNSWFDAEFFDSLCKTDVILEDNTCCLDCIVLNDTMKSWLHEPFIMDLFEANMAL